MTPEQEKEIQKIIVDKTPEQLRFKECMWTRNNIRQLIKEKYGIDIKLSTLGYYLARWGFTVQRPVKRAYKQDEKKIDEWLNREFPGITQRAEEEDAEIFFGDETNIQNTANYARGYAPKGQTPVVRVEAQKLKIEMLSAISKRGKLRFMLYKDSMNADKLIDFMTRLITDSKKKVFLILDNLRVHHAKKVTAWLEEHKEQSSFSIFLPMRQSTTRTNCSTATSNAMQVQSYPRELRQNSKQMSRIVWITCPLRLRSLHPFSRHPSLSMPRKIHVFIGGAIYIFFSPLTSNKLNEKTSCSFDVFILAV